MPSRSSSRDADPDTESEIRNARIPLERLAAHPRNYRTHPQAQVERLAASLVRFGQVKSIVVQDGPVALLVVAGHGIVEAARMIVAGTYPAPPAVVASLRQLEARVVPATWTDAQVTGYLVADNEHARGAEDDLSALLALMDAQTAAGFDIATLGFDGAELEALLAAVQEAENGPAGSKRDVDDPDGGGDDFDTTPQEGPTRSQRGDLWVLGGYTTCPKCHARNLIGERGVKGTETAHA